MAATVASDLAPSDLFRQLDEYSWSSDEEFQGGLRAILGSVQDPAQVQHLTLRAKCYYYARKAGSAVDFDGYKRWTESRAQNGAVANGADAEPASSEILQSTTEHGAPALLRDGGADQQASGEAQKPASFAEICDMIAEGKPIPGIKDIPDTILEGQASESQTNTRKKPWEKSSDVGEKLSWMT